MSVSFGALVLVLVVFLLLRDWDALSLRRALRFSGADVEGG